MAQTHHADDTDSKPLSELAARVKEWQTGSKTDAGGEPIVAINAPAGTLVGSGANIVIGAQTHVDIVSVRNTQVSAGRKLLMRATDGISLFAHKLGMKLIAALGKTKRMAVPAPTRAAGRDVPEKRADVAHGRAGPEARSLLPQDFAHCDHYRAQRAIARASGDNVQEQGVSANETFSLCGMDKARALSVFKPHIFSTTSSRT